jgi:hypothetical protein
MNASYVIKDKKRDGITFFVDRSEDGTGTVGTELF